jgi:phage shock protein PspC (stress-responsive transcriptional regulator)
MENKKLYRSNTERMIAGVAGGLGEYFNIDPTLIRILFVVLAIFGGPGLILYIIMALIVPLEPTGVLPTSAPVDNEPPMQS